VNVSRELLMRYHDGAVSEAEANEVEEALEHEPALLEELEAYSELGSFVRAWGEARSEHEIDIADSVMAKIQALEPPPSPAVRVATVHSIWPRVATWVSLGAAIAAGSVLVVRSWSAPPGMPRGAHAAGTGDQAALAAPSAAVAPPDVSAALEEEPKEPPATIESVDFGKTNGTVFVVSTDSADTPVIWMPDDDQPDEDDEDRSESL
jgi:anti-sigma factor RsiW